MSNQLTPLVRDPLATATEREWAEDMVKRIDAASSEQQRAWYREMTEDELNLVLSVYREQQATA